MPVGEGAPPARRLGARHDRAGSASLAANGIRSRPALVNIK
jgi:hypothetical protein